MKSFAKDRKIIYSQIEILLNFFIDFLSILDQFQVIKKKLQKKSDFKPLRYRRGGGYPDLSGLTPKKTIFCQSHSVTEACVLFFKETWFLR